MVVRGVRPAAHCDGLQVGPRETTKREGGAEKDVQVLPLRMERADVEAMGEAWRWLGLKSRTEMIRCALRAYFAGAGEAEVASRL